MGDGSYPSTIRHTLLPESLESTPAMPHYLGLDLGGTNIKAGLIDQAGRVLVERSAPTRSDRGPEAVLERMLRIADEVATEAGCTLRDVQAIGIGSPGPIDVRRGLVLSAPNMPGWEDFPLRDRLGERTGRPTFLENDANAAAFGEFCFGAGRDPSIQHLVMVTLGTGVGGGIVSDGRIVHGGFGIAAEVGHMIVAAHGRRCGCGQQGCLEMYASASAVARRGLEAVESGQATTLRQIYDQHNRELTAKDIFTAADAGDALARQIVDEATTFLGIACVSLCRLLDPQMIVFAGGLILAGDHLFDGVRAGFARHNWRILETKVQIVPALLGNQAGIIGAAAVAMQGLRDSGAGA